METALVKRRFGVGPYVLAGSTLLWVLFYTPVLLPAFEVVGGGGYLSALTVLMATWIVALVKTCQPILSEQGRSRFRGRPRTTIGGKSWSPPGINLITWGAVIGTPFAALGSTYWGRDKAYAWSLVVQAAVVAFLLVKQCRRHAAARAVLPAREWLAVDELWARVQKPRAKYLDSLHCVEEVMAVPYGHLRPTDRFGVQIGSLMRRSPPKCRYHMISVFMR